MVPPTLEKTAYRPLERWGTFIIMAFALLLGLTVLWR